MASDLQNTIDISSVLRGYDSRANIAFAMEKCKFDEWITIAECLKKLSQGSVNHMLGMDLFDATKWTDCYRHWGAWGAFCASLWLLESLNRDHWGSGVKVSGVLNYLRSQCKTAPRCDDICAAILKECPRAETREREASDARREFYTEWCQSHVYLTYLWPLPTRYPRNSTAILLPPLQLSPVEVRTRAAGEPNIDQELD